ncbi:MAG: transporter [Verrucomicrobiales bacterium]|nr:transporter [Verrucomicrobiales bacterium]
MKYVISNLVFLPFLTLSSPAATSSVPTSGGSLPEVIAQAPSGGVKSPGGVYGNPAWTKHRRFATARVFVQRDPWEVGLSQWWRGRFYDGKSSRHRFSEEIEIGLPHRFQLDFYYDWVHQKGETEFLDVAAEVRWALADWDVIPLNPTLYAEYKWTDEDMGGDVVELKLLLGDDIGENWAFGINFVWEQELSGEKTTEWQGTGGLSYTISDAISIGAEFKYVHETVEGSRGNPEHKVLLGPSFQWRPTHNTHLDIVALAGLTDDSPDLEAWVIFGVDFDFGGSGSKKVHQPVSGVRD